MVILRQETLLIYLRSKGKFTPGWAILSYDAQIGPVLALFEDSTAKRQIGEKFPLAGMAAGIRFGTTSLSHMDSSMDTGGQFLKDPRVDKSLLIAFINVPERRPSGSGKKASRSGPIWLCSTSLQQFHEFIKALSESLVALGLPAPDRSQVESVDALHNYKPRPFVPANDWDHFWDCPGPFVLPKPPAAMDTLKSVSTMNVGGGGGGGTYRTGQTLHGYTSGEAASPTMPSTTKSSHFSMSGGAPSRMSLISSLVDDQAIPILCRVRELPEVPFQGIQAKKWEEADGKGKGKEEKKKNHYGGAPPPKVERTEMVKVFGMAGMGQQSEGGRQREEDDAVVERAWEWDDANPAQMNGGGGNEVTVIQLLDDAIEEGGKDGGGGRMPAPPIPRHQPQAQQEEGKYTDAEVQTEQSMATTTDGFWPLFVAAAAAEAEENEQQQQAKGSIEKQRRASSTGNCAGGRSISSASNGDFVGGPAHDRVVPEGATHVEVRSMEPLDTRFYRVQLAEVVEGKRRRATVEEEEEATQF